MHIYTCIYQIDIHTKYYNIIEYLKKINTNKTAVTYSIPLQIFVYTETGIPIYVGSKTDKLTFSSPGPRRITNLGKDY